MDRRDPSGRSGARARRAQRKQTRGDSRGIPDRPPRRLVSWIRDRAFPVREGDGNVVRVAGVAEDITAAGARRRRLGAWNTDVCRLLSGINATIVRVVRSRAYVPGMLSHRGQEGRLRAATVSCSMVDPLEQRIKLRRRQPRTRSIQRTCPMALPIVG